MKALKSPIFWIIILAIVIGMLIGTIHHQRQNNRTDQPANAPIHSDTALLSKADSTKPLAQEQAEATVVAEHTPHNIAAAEQQTLQAQHQVKRALKNSMPEDSLITQESRDHNPHESAVLN